MFLIIGIIAVVYSVVFARFRFLYIVYFVLFQDYMGEAPIHKAARAGSMGCISALLFSGAKPE